MPPIARLAALVLFAAPLAAAPQGGGFTPGELILYNPALTGGSSTAGGVVRIDPTTGTVSTIVLLTGSSQSLQGSICYDPFRDRVVFLGAWPTTSDPKRLWAADAAGNMTDLGLSGVTLSSLTPGPGGRIYARGPSPATPIVYVDAANQLQTLMDASGTQPFQPPSWDTRGMIYHPGLNALFVANFGFSPWNCGDTNPSLVRVRLSDDYTRVVAVDGCVSLPVDPGAGGNPVGLSMGPGGQLLVTVDTNSNAQQPRMQIVDPNTMSATTFAANGYPGAAATNGGTWSHLLGKAVILDTGQDVLRAYAQGETGAGTILVPSSTISSPGGSGEIATLIEISADPCSDLIATYCTAKLTSNGCLPELSTDGCPSASAVAGFDVIATQVIPGNLGLFLYSTSGPNASPALGGTLCIAPPFTRTTPSIAGGAGSCGGQYAFDFNAWAAGASDPALVAGAVVYGQYWFRDPPDAQSAGLTGGVTFTLAP